MRFEAYPGSLDLVVAALVFELIERITRAAEQQGRSIGQRLSLRLHGYLGQVDIVTPDIQAIGEQPLFIGFDIRPAEFTGPADFERARSALEYLAVRIE